MRILLINPPYRAVSSAHGLGEQTPLGLLAIGGPLLDAGHEVTLLDAEVLRLSVPQVAEHARRLAPDLVLTGHGGSTPAHPTVVEMARAIKLALPEVPIVYGGVFPTYHGAEILAAEPSVDIVVRGEGEQTTLDLVAALSDGQPLASVPGLFVRQAGRVVTTPDAPPIKLDAYRIGWELIEDWGRYQCWGVGRSVIIQLSRGCPHRCTYCGQRDFWTRWRHRDPERVAAEIGWLQRRHGVNFVDLADENPTTSRKIWRRFLEAMIAQAVPVKLFASIRASDIVRDADMLHLYKAAGLVHPQCGTRMARRGTRLPAAQPLPTPWRPAVRVLGRTDDGQADAVAGNSSFSSWRRLRNVLICGAAVSSVATLPRFVPLIVVVRPRRSVS